jgi:hypothetical protein
MPKLLRGRFRQLKSSTQKGVSNAVLRSLLITISLTVVFLSACEKESGQLFSQESDGVFRGGQRSVVKPLGKNWVLYYFPTESLESLRDKVQLARFYKEEGWTPFAPSGDGEYMSGNAEARTGGLASITLYQGKLNSSITGLDASNGASILLIPKR